MEGKTHGEEAGETLLDRPGEAGAAEAAEAEAEAGPEATAESEAEARIVAVLEGNPAYRRLYGALIDHCERRRSLEEALDFCAGRRTSPSQILSPAAVVDALARCGALLQTAFVDGVPYGGTLEELRADENLPEETVVRIEVQSTPAGLAAARTVARSHSPEALMERHPERAAAFRLVLGECAREGGATTRELQRRLKEADLLETEAARGIDGLHGSYFTGALESAGALAWNGKAWIVTDEGRGALAL